MLTDLKLVLASKSPRRVELLQLAGIPFSIRTFDIDESVRAGETPSDYVHRLAYEKANSVVTFHHELILAADTTVVLEGKILGKPDDEVDAKRMIRSLSGKRHEVVTGVCLRQGNYYTREVDTTSVWFMDLREDEIEEYVASGEPMDKAGGYGIQGLASKYIERIEGSYTNVVGLPIALIYKHIREYS